MSHDNSEMVDKTFIWILASDYSPLPKPIRKAMEHVGFYCWWSQAKSILYVHNIREIPSQGLLERFVEAGLEVRFEHNKGAWFYFTFKGLNPF